MKNGFTLVELSIVLVIIGLLIGGILVGQSLINSAKIQGVVRQISQYDIAIATFISKYKQLPGDSNLFPDVGNNNGLTDGNESGSVWQHLSAGAGLKNSQNTVYASNLYFSPITETTCPRFKIDQFIDASVANSNGIPCFNVQWTTWPTGSVLGLYQYRSGPNYLSPTYAPLRPVDAAAIDQKLDNGIAGNGVGAGGSTAGKVFSWGSSGFGGNCVTGTSYDTAVSGYTCMLNIYIGITNDINNE